MTKFRRKSGEVEAIQWTGDNWDDIVKFTDNNVLSQINDSITLGIGVGVSRDWWIIKKEGEFSTCKPDLFKIRYEEV